jgi:hypothetical protein
MAKNEAFRQLESIWGRWLKLRVSTFRRQPAEHTTGIDWRKANGTKDHPVWDQGVEPARGQRTNWVDCR